MSSTKQNYRVPFIMMVVLFFLFGFLTVLNGQLQSPIKIVFNLSNFQTSLLTFSFFSAFVLTGPLASKMIDRMGNKKTLVIALCVLGIALSVFLSAAFLNSFAVFVGGSFILGAGITILQVVANPYLAALGSPETAGTRINLAGAFNSLAGTLAPIFAANVIFGKANPVVDDVKLPYVFLTGFAFLLALIFSLIKLPNISASVEESNEGETKELVGNAWQFSHLTLGVIAIFAYVGAEVAIGNNIKTYIDSPSSEVLKSKKSDVYSWLYTEADSYKTVGDTALVDSLLTKLIPSDTSQVEKADSVAALNALIALKAKSDAAVVQTNYPEPIKYFIEQKKEVINIGKASGIIASLYWGSIMIGRFIGSFVFKNANARKGLVLVSALAMILTLIGTFFPGTMAFQEVNLGFTQFTIFGNAGIYALVAVGLFHSVMWGYIFGLAIDKLGPYTNQASGYLIMGIFGGAIVPTIQSIYADSTNNWQITFILVALCQAYLLYYALIGSKIKKHA